MRPVSQNIVHAFLTKYAGTDATTGLASSSWGSQNGFADDQENLNPIRHGSLAKSCSA
jgi:hypothetical protein